MQGRGGGGGVSGHGRRPERQPPPPPPPRNCPRCDSMNTKFCYYNNYSLSQPRYSCRDCQRYWTHGGTLRNIPYGGSSRKLRQPITLTPTTNTNPTNHHQHHQPLPITNNVSLPQPIHYGGVRFLPSSSSSPLRSVLGGGFQSPELDVPTMHGFNHPHQLHHQNLFPPPPASVAAVPALDHQPAVAAAENPEAFWKDLLGGSSLI